MKANLMRNYENGKIVQLEIQLVAENMHDAFFMGETTGAGGHFPEVVYTDGDPVHVNYPPEMLITLRKSSD